MKMYEAKFNQLYKGKTYVEIEIIDESPLTTMYCRYNQSRMVCSCMEESSVAKLKDKNGVKQIECDTYNCQYRQKNEQGKMACNRKGWLRFVMPTISRNGVFIMQISSQESIENLKNYFEFKQWQGLSIKGQYILFLNQKEQTNSLGQTFNNFILNIIPKEDFIQANQNPQKTENTTSLSTKNTQNVNKDVVKEQETDNNNNNKTIISKTDVKEQNENQNVNATVEQQATTKKTRKNKKAKNEEQKEETSKKNIQNANETSNTKKTVIQETQEISKVPENSNNENADNSKNKNNSNTEDSLSNYYMLINTFKGMIKDKNGIEKEYLIGNFHDMEDKPYEIVLKPQDAIIETYGEGTIAKIDVKEVLQRKFAINLEYINIMPKEKVA